jgi:hypothetical protein
MSGKNRVGAAWSAYRMVAYEHGHGAETCPVLGYHQTFSPLLKKCLGERRQLGASVGREASCGERRRLINHVVYGVESVCGARGAIG